MEIVKNCINVLYDGSCPLCALEWSLALLPLFLFGKSYPNSATLLLCQNCPECYMPWNLDMSIS